MKPFKVGDRVAVYDGVRRVGYVTALGADDFIGGVEVQNIMVDTQAPGSDLGRAGWKWRNYVHPKQCRRLKKRELRRVWVRASQVQYHQEPKAAEHDWIEFVEKRPK